MEEIPTKNSIFIVSSFTIYQADVWDYDSKLQRFIIPGLKAINYYRASNVFLSEDAAREYLEKTISTEIKHLEDRITNLQHMTIQIQKIS